MRTYYKINIRSWHIWSGVILSLPVFLVCVTAIFIAHEKALGLKKIPMRAGWLPGYSTRSAGTKCKEIKCVLTTQEDLQYVGTKQGLFIFNQEKLYSVEELKGADVKNIVECPHGVLVVTNKDVWSFEGPAWNKTFKGDVHKVWSLEGTAWNKIFKGDVHNVSVTRDGHIYLTTVDDGLQISRDGGKSWTLEGEIAACLDSLPTSKVKQKIDFNKLLVDLHTGRALFGKQFSWLWTDITAFALIFLTVSGIYRWWKVKKVKRHNAKFQQ